MLALEGIGLATLDLQVQEGCQIGDFLLHSSKTYQTIQLCQTVRDVHRLGSLVRYILLLDGHQFLVCHIGDAGTLQPLGLLLTDLVKERTHRTAIGKVFVTGVIHLRDHLLSQFLTLFREDVFLVLGEDKHNLEQLVWRVVFNIKEIVETATEARIDAEEILHLHPIAGSDDNKLAAVILHPLHQFLQSLCALIVTFSCCTQWCQGISLIHKKDAPHRLVAQTVDDLGSLSLVGADHLRTVYLHYMSTIEITYRSQYLAQFSGDGRLSRSRITRQDDVHRHLLLFAQTTCSPLHGILHRIGHLTDSTLHLSHTNEVVEILQDVLNRTFLRHVALNV